MATQTTAVKTQRGHLKNGTTTTISIEKALLSSIKTDAFNKGQSVSQWIRDAVLKRIKRPVASSK